MDLRRTLLARLTLAFAVLLLLFGLVWLKDLREDALAEQQATVHLIELLLASPDDDAPARLAAALTPGQFRHVKLDMSAPEPMSPGTPAQPQGLLPWLGLSMEGAQAHRIRVGTQDLWISPDPDSEFREKLSTSVQVLIMLVLFCGICLGLTWFAVDHALSPVKELNAGLVRLAAGQERAQLPGFALREFAAIAQVVDQLADSLSRARESQRRLTRQLMEVQDKERRELAAELHDEFGQSLTAISATAAYIEHHAHHADGDHPGHHGIGCDRALCPHDEVAHAAAGHDQFGTDQRHPTQARADAQTRNDGRYRGRKQHLGDRLEAADAQHAGRLQEPHIHVLGAAIGVDQAGWKRAGKDDERGAADARSEPQRSEGNPCHGRNEPQPIEQGCDDVVQPAKPTHRQTQWNADQGRHSKPHAEAVEAGQHVVHQGGACERVVEKVDELGQHLVGHRQKLWRRKVQDAGDVPEGEEGHCSYRGQAPEPRRGEFVVHAATLPWRHGMARAST